MVLLVLGVLLWSAAHCFAVSRPAARDRLIRQMGDGPYRGVFSLVILGSLALMVLGWRATVPSLIYAPPAWGFAVALGVAFVSLLLFVASAMPSNLKRIIRHPQLVGLTLWSIGHLLANGDQRSLVLFGGLGVWALLSIVMINRRDGAWSRPAAVAAGSDFVSVLFAAGVWIALLYAHPYFTGMPLLKV